MEKPKFIKVWDILYPVCIYFAVTTVALVLLDSVLPESVDSKLLRQLLTSFAAVPFLFSFYRQDEKLRGTWKSRRDKSGIKRIAVKIFAVFVTGGCFAAALNNLLGMFHITDYSASYGQIEETFYTGRLLLEITALCLVIPVTEELLYRGIVYRRARDCFGIRYAVPASAVIFGLIHMNLVQFVYAAIFGLLLAYVTEEGGLACAFAAHIAANLTSVLRAETKLFAFLDQSVSVSVCMTIVLFLVSAVGIRFFIQQNPGQDNKIL